jgi:hypothetical protein
MKSKWGRVVFWALAVTAVLYVCTRIVVVLLSARRQDEVGTSPWVGEAIAAGLLLTVLVVIALFRRNAAQARAALPALRSRYPDAVVMRSVLRAEDRGIMGEIAETTGAYKPPQTVAVVLQSDSVSWWIGCRPKLIANARVVPREYRVGSLTHGFSDFRALFATCEADGAQSEVPIILARDNTAIPRHLDAGQYQEIRDRLVASPRAQALPNAYGERLMPER